MKRIQIETISDNCKNKDFLELIKVIKNKWGIILISKDLIIKWNITSFYFYFKNNIYLVQLEFENLNSISISSNYKPNKEFWTGTIIYNRITPLDLIDKLDTLPANYYYQGLRSNGNSPIFYKDLNEFVESHEFMNHIQY